MVGVELSPLLPTPYGLKDQIQSVTLARYAIAGISRARCKGFRLYLALGVIQAWIARPGR